jgi:hypothetical protein
VGAGIASIAVRGAILPIRSRCAAALAVVWVLAVLATTGCMTTQPVPKVVTDVKQLVGAWEGWIGCHGCSTRFRSRLLVREGGYYEMVNERNPSYYGKFGIVNGVLQYGAEGRWYGSATIVEERGHEWLTLYRANGEVWTEFDRAK